MFERLTDDARHTVTQAAKLEARGLGSRTVEAEHLLLALADPRTPVGGLLAAHGLDHDGLVSVLELETDRSLAAVGVCASDFGLPGTPAASIGPIRFGSSTKRALARAVNVASGHGDRALTPAHLLAGILRAELGTVPRALAFAEVDRPALVVEVDRLLG